LIKNCATGWQCRCYKKMTTFLPAARRPLDHMDEDSPKWSWVPQSHRSHVEWSSQYGSKSPALEVVGCEWRYALLVVQARNDDDDDEASSRAEYEIPIPRYLLSLNVMVLCQGLFEIYNRMQCVREVRSRVARSTTAVRNICGCAAPCSEISYDVSYSLSRWPAESFDGDEAYTDIFQAIASLFLTLCLSGDNNNNSINYNNKTRVLEHEQHGSTTELQSCHTHIHTRTYIHRRSILNPASPTGGGGGIIIIITTIIRAFLSWKRSRR